MGKLIKCRIPGCKAMFSDEQQSMLHTATDWHCAICGMSDGSEMTMENVDRACTFCITATTKIDYYRVDFKSKCYVVFKAGKVARFVKKEEGKWVSYG